MKAIDTNVVVRIITADDPVQAPVALALVAAARVFVSHTVLMEAEWVLRSSYRWARADIAEALDDVINLEGVHVLDEEGLLWALDRYRGGADWADMLHLLAARGMQSFLSFDRSVASDAGADGPIAIELLQ